MRAAARPARRPLHAGTGLYDPATGKRLFAYDAAGNELRDWMILLSMLDML